MGSKVLGILIVSSAIPFGSCQSPSAMHDSIRPVPTNSEGSNTDKVPKIESLETYDRTNSEGLISLTGKLLRIYNQDGSVWFQLSLANEEAARASLDRNENFRPFRYDTDDWSIHLNYVDQDKRYYHVIVNDETGLKKFIKKDDQNFKTGKWKQYILDCFAVEFNSETNPLRNQPNGKIQGNDIPKEWTRKPEEINGDWLKIGWHENNDNKRKRDHGWIKWKENDKLVIVLFEIA